MARESIDVATGALGSLLPKLALLLQDGFKHNLPKSARHDIHFLSMELQMIHTVLRDVANSRAEQQGHIKLWALDVRELSYDVEDAVDTILVRLGLESTEASSTRSRFMKITMRATTHKFSDEIKEIKSRVIVVCERCYRYMNMMDDSLHKPQVSTIYPPSLPDLYVQHRLVGIDQAADELVGMLALEGDAFGRRLKTVSIVGMGGLGKTTLAKLVYQSLKDQFQCGAFVSVSQCPDMNKVFRDMLYQLGEENYSNIQYHADKDVEQLIRASRDYLKNKRYFIVVDDIWSREAWEMIRSALFENNYGSRVITTTRIFEVASTASDVYRMRLLSRENSKKLFCNRMFSGEDYPDSGELAELRDKLLEKYDGLPLAVLTIAGAFAGKPIEQWYEVYKSIAFGHVNGRVMDDMIHKLSSSYYDLPSHLRTCLLYLSIFPRNYLIKKDLLIWRWIAEGFIWKDRHARLFEMGESYLQELIDRCLIQPVETGDKGSVDCCRVHGAVLDLLRYLAREENFVTLLIEKEQNISPRWLALQKGNNEDHTLQTDISLAKVRSFNASMCSANMMPLLSGFRFLRVLALEYCPSIKSYHLKYVGKLFLLRYLGLVGTPISGLPDGIGELEFLQTLDLRETGIQELPRTVCHLRKLMCLCVDSTARLLRGIGNLVDMEDLRLYSVMTLNFVKEELGQLTKLRFLEIRFKELDEQMEDAFLRSLSNLQNLQTLVVDVFGGSFNFDRMAAELIFVPPPHLRRFKAVTMTRTALPAWIGSLSELSYLSIEVTELRQGDLKILGGLPYLCSLWISSRSNERPLVVTVEDGFPCLREFTLLNGAFGPDFQRGAMPKVERVQFSFSPRDARTSADFGFGLENLLSLKHVTVHLPVYYGNYEVHNVEAALRHATYIHPRHPTITVIRDGEESTDTAASNDTRTQEELAEMEAKQLEERRNKFIQELHEENLLLDELQAQLMDIRA
uniref:AAA+ ATPase domain-containing protein n=1 Tax=Oryza punctata TaxID=4537 RepID=A0A0E0MI95_ORYPU